MLTVTWLTRDWNTKCNSVSITNSMEWQSNDMLTPKNIFCITGAHHRRDFASETSQNNHSFFYQFQLSDLFFWKGNPHFSIENQIKPEPLTQVWFCCFPNSISLRYPTQRPTNHFFPATLVSNSDPDPHPPHFNFNNTTFYSTLFSQMCRQKPDLRSHGNLLYTMWGKGHDKPRVFHFLLFSVYTLSVCLPDADQKSHSPVKSDRNTIFPLCFWCINQWRTFRRRNCPT